CLLGGTTVVRNLPPPIGCLPMRMGCASYGSLWQKGICGGGGGLRDYPVRREWRRSHFELPSSQTGSLSLEIETPIELGRWACAYMQRQGRSVSRDGIPPLDVLVRVSKAQMLERHRARLSESPKGSRNVWMRRDTFEVVHAVGRKEKLTHTNRSGQVLDVRGFVGHLVAHASPAAIRTAYEWLSVAQIWGAGIHATWGWGNIQIQAFE
ncbi:MAG: hypothetical protein ACYCYO_20795, partial [Bacilli bacterium]